MEDKNTEVSCFNEKEVKHEHVRTQNDPWTPMTRDHDATILPKPTLDPLRDMKSSENYIQSLGNIP